jgi:hypothetical protein
MRDPVIGGLIGGGRQVIGGSEPPPGRRQRRSQDVPQFLSESWFSEVDKLRAEAGEIPVPDAVKNIKLNIVVTDHPEGEKQMHMAAGQFNKGLLDDASTKLTIPFPIAVKTFIEGDQQAGMQAFMSGQVKVEGDMSVMMQMQAAGPPSAEAQALQDKIKAITEA